MWVWVGTREGHFPRVFSNVFIDNHDEEEEAIENIVTLYECVRIYFQELTNFRPMYSLKKKCVYYGEKLSSVLAILSP